MKKDLNSLIDQALENINNDRQETEILLAELKEYLSVSKEKLSLSEEDRNQLFDLINEDKK